MTYDRFKELWDTHVTNHPSRTPPMPCPHVPRLVDRMSDSTIEALIRASDGDFTVFDEINRILAELDQVQWKAAGL